MVQPPGRFWRQIRKGLTVGPCALHGQSNRVLPERTMTCIMQRNPKPALQGGEPCFPVEIQAQTVEGPAQGLPASDSAGRSQVALERGQAWGCRGAGGRCMRVGLVPLPLADRNLELHAGSRA